MKKTVLVYGILGGVLIAALRLIEYRFLVLEHSLEIYGGIVALIFSGLGIWLGLKLTRTRETVIVREVNAPFAAMAAGHSNREIAERLFVSENTVKTHALIVSLVSAGVLSRRRKTPAGQHEVIPSSRAAATR